MGIAYINKKIIPLENAKIPITSLAFTLGASVFEAVRVYWNKSKRTYYIFNLRKHIQRLFCSLQIMRMKINYKESEIIQIITQLVKQWNKKTNGYIRVTAYIENFSHSGSVYDPETVTTKLCVTIVENNLSLEMKDSITCCISSWTRINDNSIPPRVKSACNYENTRLAGHEAILNGYDNAILINVHGKVSEAAESSIFFVDQHNFLVTPSITSDILASITRELILEIAEKELKIQCIERMVDRTELYCAKEVFICNTAKLIRPVKGIDQIDINNGNIGKITQDIITEFRKIIIGNNEKYLGDSILVNV